MGEAHPYEYEAVSIPSYESVSAKSMSLHASQDEVQVTHDMVFRLYYEEENVSEAGDFDVLHSVGTIHDEDNIDGGFTPQLMIIYEAGDIDCALHFLMDSLQEPFSANALATVLVEESIREKFVNRVVAQMRPLSPKVAKNFRYLRTLNAIERMDLEIIKMKTTHSTLYSPIMVCNCVQSILGSGQTGVICLNTFRSTLEAVDISRRDRTPFASASIWNENIEGLYQLTASLSCPIIYFNCNNISLEPISAHAEQRKTTVCVVNNYHYETLTIYNNVKIIIFPIGAHLMQGKAAPPPSVMSPIEYLNE